MNKVCGMTMEETKTCISDVEKEISENKKKLKELTNKKKELLGCLNLLEKREEIKCIACRDTGRSYWTDGIYGDCMECDRDT